ncbi:MAG: CHAP domain-containing protein [Microbacteriaceae bacterium]
MRGTRRRGIAAALAAALALAALVSAALVPGPTASASTVSSPTSAILCQGYTACAALGMTNHGYSKRTGSYWRMVAGHNCTNYAAYLLVKAGAKRSRPWSGSGNASAWGAALGYNSTPKAGAIAWWAANKDGAGAYGHVAYVEAVISSTEIVISEDNYGGDFYWKVITADDPHWPTGFIHKKQPGVASGVTAESADYLDTTFYTDSTLRTTFTADHLAPGESVWVRVRYKNLGSTPWTDLVLGTPFTSSSGIADGWLSAARAAAQRETEVDIGGTASFVFAVTAPTDVADGTSVDTVMQPVSSTLGWVRRGKTTLSLVVDSRASFTISPTPTITGTAKQGHVLTAHTGAWGPVTPSFGYQWYRDGVAISGATGATRTVSAADVGHTLTVTVRASADGYIPLSVSSASTATVRSAWSSTLARGSTLSRGDQLVSANGKYRAAVTASGKVAIVNRFTGAAVWSTGRVKAKKLKLRSDGTLVAYTASGAVAWYAAKGSKASRLVLTSTGKLVLFSASGKQRWKTGT